MTVWIVPRYSTRGEALISHFIIIIIITYLGTYLSVRRWFYIESIRV